MSLSVESRRVVYSGNGSATVFAIPFTFQSNSSYVAATLYDTTTKEFTAQVITTDYTISGSNLTMLTAPASGKKLVIYSLVPLSQGESFSNSTTFLPADVMDGLDKLAQQIQQVDEKVNRAPKFNKATALDDIDFPATMTADATVVVNADGDGFDWGPTVGEIEGWKDDAESAASAAASSASSSSSSASAASSSASAAAASAAAAAASAAAIGTDFQESVAGVYAAGDTTYTLAHTPGSAAGVKAFLGSAVQIRGTHYTISGAVITFAGEDVSATNLNVFYRY